jgi:hypothetical protein
LILIEDGLEKDGGSDFLSVCNGVRLGLARPVCALNSQMDILVGLRLSDDVCRYEV